MYKGRRSVNKALRPVMLHTQQHAYYPRNISISTQITTDLRTESRRIVNIYISSEISLDVQTGCCRL